MATEKGQRVLNVRFCSKLVLLERSLLQAMLQIFRIIAQCRKPISISKEQTLYYITAGMVSWTPCHRARRMDQRAVDRTNQMQKEHSYKQTRKKSQDGYSAKLGGVS